MLKLTLAVLTFCLFGGIANASEAPDASELFAQKAIVYNLFEIEASKLALDKSNNARVRKFSETLLEDHSQLGGKLESALALSEMDISRISKALDEEHQKVMDELKFTVPEDFNNQFIRTQKDMLNQSQAFFEDYAKHGDNTALKDFASGALSMLEKHKEQLQELAAD